MSSLSTTIMITSCCDSAIASNNSGTCSSPHVVEQEDDEDCIQVRFDGLVDLQTRLMLLPRVEEEGRGAVVESFVESEEEENDKKEIVPDLVGYELMGLLIHETMSTGSGGGSNRNNDEEQSPEADATEEKETESAEDDQDDGEPQQQEQSTTRESSVQVVREDEFSSILAQIREASPPLVLCFTKPSSCTTIIENEEQKEEVVRREVKENGEEDCPSSGFQEEKKSEMGDLMTSAALPQPSSISTTDAVATTTMTIQKEADDGTPPAPSAADNNFPPCDDDSSESSSSEEENDDAQQQSSSGDGNNTSSNQQPSSTEEAAATAESSTGDTNKNATTHSPTTTTHLLGANLSTWTTRMNVFKATSAQFAEQAATSAASLAAAAKERMNSPPPPNQSSSKEEEEEGQEENNHNNNNNNRTDVTSAKAGMPEEESYDARSNVITPLRNTTPIQGQKRRLDTTINKIDASIYLHTSLGAWFSLDGESVNNNKSMSNGYSELSLTNSTMIAVRQSETQPFSNTDYHYQWYRSRGYVPSTPVNSPVKNIIGPPTPPQQQAEENCLNNRGNDDDADEDGWTLLENATLAAIQPSATEVGHRLRCVITENQNEGENGGDDDEEDGEGVVVAVCETRGVVSAAPPLFNGARQALVRGAQFGGLVGRGKLQGRSFLLKVEMALAEPPPGGRNNNCSASSSATDKPTQSSSPSNRHVTSALTIYQVAGGTAEPIHEQPIRYISARIKDYSSAKGFEIVLSNIPLTDSYSMLRALANDDGSLEMEASNRLARESLLLAIGIANYGGKPIDLEATTILYDSPATSKPVEVMVDTPETASANCSDTDSGDTSNRTISEEPKNDDGETSTPLSPTSALPLPEQTQETASEASISPRLMIPRPPQRSHSLGAAAANSSADSAAADRVKELEKELQLLRGKLEGKNKVCSELQRHLTQREKDLSKAQQRVAYCDDSLRKITIEKQNLQQSQRLADKRITNYEEMLRQLKTDHETKSEAAASKIKAQSDQITHLEKQVRNFQNEKAVLSAAVEARESKLSKMDNLQRSFDKLSEKVAENESLREQVEDGDKRYKDKCAELQKRLAELEQTQLKLTDLKEHLKKEKVKTTSHQTEHEALQMKIQKLIAERNSYKQKGDSLAKEIGRVCQRGRTIREVEKLIADDASRQQEVELLREQKRKALEELEHYRTSYEQTRVAQTMAGMDHDSAKILERNVELERLLSELTEYVTAKEMQLDTLKQINEALQHEIRDLAKANMSKNDV